MKDLQTKKNTALEAYKVAKAEFLASVTDGSFRGDPVKWIAFCEAKRTCMLLGCRI